jgi:hypothetical protein
MSLNREPVAIAGFIRAAILCAVGFGLDWSAEQVAGLMLAVEGFLSLVVRQSVTPAADTDLGGDAGQATFWPGVLVGIGVTLAWLAFFGPK